MELFESHLLNFDPAEQYGSSANNNTDTRLLVRPLKMDDMKLGYGELLSQLTTIGDLSETSFVKKFNLLKKIGTNYIVVIEDLEKKTIAATGTLVVEHKFIHGCSSRGRVEDIVVDKDYRGQSLGKKIMEVLVELSKKLGNYKVSLECKDNLVGFYGKFGFKKEAEQNYLALRF